jgi:hypothetical protein
MDRRQLLKLLALGVVGHTIDVDRLLWVPEVKTIFIPTTKKVLSYSEIVALELERVLPKMKQLFERDEIFFANLDWNRYEIAPETTIFPNKEDLDWDSDDES